MKEKFPHTYTYLKNFEAILRERAAYKKYFNPEEDPFYSMYNIGTYTFSRYKLAWKLISKDFISCVVRAITAEYIGEKVIIPNHKLMIIGLNRLQEAHYLCALCNSSISRVIVKSYAVETGLSPHIMENINIPKFNAENKIHLRLSELSQQAHSAAKLGIKGRIKDIEEEIDFLAASLWGLTRDELKGIKSSLAELY